MRRSLLWIVLAVDLFLVGCAAAPKAGMPALSAPSAEPEPEPTTIEDAQAQIDRAKAALGGAPPTTVQMERAPAAPPSPSPQSTEAPPSAGATAEPANPCVSACRAIASMRRAVGVVCRIAGEEDPRCSDAKKTLNENERKVARCGC